MSTILPCLLGVLTLLDGVAVVLDLVATGIFGLVWYICHGVELLALSLLYIGMYKYLCYLISGPRDSGYRLDAVARPSRTYLDLSPESCFRYR